jgi:hypothetical protein
VEPAFGKPMVNAEGFKDMTFNLKTCKKRTHNEANPNKVPAEEENMKRLKGLNGAEKLVEENGELGNKENVGEN